jgi:hypothetical protein
VTDQSQPTAPQPGESLPQRGEPLPQRAGSEPLRGGSAYEPLPQRGDGPPQRGDGLPQRGDGLPQRGDGLPQRGGSIFDPLPRRSEPLPQRPGTAFEPLPQRGDSFPQQGDALPQRGQQQTGAEPLPRRTTRKRPGGRHRSPHRLSVASDAPSLVIAVPGTAEQDSAGVGHEVAAIAELSCPGVDIRVGYLEGYTQALAEVIDEGTESDGQQQFPSVIVPLLISPSPRVDDALRRIAAQPAVPAVVAAHLGPHPLLAEALHARLAEAGLARHARSTGLSISVGGRGVVVLADVGSEAAGEASIVAVLLASRLSVPVMPASLGDPASIADAVTRLSDSGASRPALAPCLIGPGTSLAVFDDLSAALGAPCAAPLGAHQAIGQLVAMRYGAALATLSLAG